MMYIDQVSKHAAEVVPQCNVLIAMIPSFAYTDVFRDLKPYLRKGMFLAISPGQVCQ